MELINQKKLVNHIFRLLKVNEIVIPIGRTNKGNLGIKFTQNSDDFEIYLDAVPLPTKDILVDDNNIELKRMLEKYLYEVPFVPPMLYRGKEVEFYKDTGISSKDMQSLAPLVDNGTTEMIIGKVVNTAGEDVTDKILGKKRGGRPKGSKNKPKVPKVDGSGTN